MNNVISKKLCWLMAFVLFLTWTGLFPTSTFAKKGTVASASDPKQAAERLEGLFNALEELAGKIPRDTFDPQAVVGEVGYDSHRLFQWVRDNTYLVPYLGSLRGPTGVLMDRLGNSLDRALLLNELLRLAGHRTRLARGTLTDRQAEEVLAKVHPVPRGTPLPPAGLSPKAVEDLLEKYAERYRLNRGGLRGVMAKMILQQQRLAEEVAQRVADQVQLIGASLGIPDRKEQEAAIRGEAIKSLKDHWWVQLAEDSDWTNLDPTLPDADVGRGLAEVENTYSKEDLGEEVLHVVTIRIVVEQWKEDVLKEKTVLEHTIRPSELFGERILLRHIPMDWPEDLNLWEVENPTEALKTVTRKQREWLPVLMVGANLVYQSSFTDSGKINKEPRREPASQTGGIVRRGLTLFGPPEEESERDSHVTAEWVEYEICVPGQPLRTIRRQVFDLLGAAARLQREVQKPEIDPSQRIERALAILGQTEILNLVSQLSSEFVEYMSARDMLSNRNIFLSLVQGRTKALPQDVLDQLGQLVPLPGMIFSLASARSKLGPVRGEAYLDRPNILSHFTALRENTEGELVHYERFDIVANEVAPLIGRDAHPFQIRLEQGVVDTNVEALLIGELGGEVENAAEIFARANAQGIKPLLLKSARDPAWQQADLDKDVLTRIEKDLAEGYVVLVPERTVSTEGKPVIGWWRIDPQKGHTLGLGEHGWGQSMTEYAEKIEIVLQLKTIIKFHADVMRCLALGVTSPLRGERPQDDPLVQKCVWDIACNNVLNIAGALTDVETNWTNLIIQKTIDELWEGLCAGL